MKIISLGEVGNFRGQSQLSTYGFGNEVSEQWRVTPAIGQKYTERTVQICRTAFAQQTTVKWENNILTQKHQVCHIRWRNLSKIIKDPF